MTLYDILAYNLIAYCCLALLTRKPALLALLLISAGLLLNWPLRDGLSLLAWLYGFLAAPAVLSVALFVLLAVQRQTRDMPCPPGLVVLLFCWATLCILGMAGLLGNVDLYHAPPLWRFVALAVMMTLGIALDRRFVLVAIAVLLAYLLALMNSINIIDYSVDVFLWLFSGGALLHRLLRWAAAMWRTRLRNKADPDSGVSAKSIRYSQIP